MQIVVVGSVALDTIHTPNATQHGILGGSAAYFSLAAAQLASVGLVAVVGDDFPPAARQILVSRGIDLLGLETRAGRTFRWAGEYTAELKERRTLSTAVGVFGGFHPQLPREYVGAQVLFLGNIAPQLQQEVLERAGAVALTAVDTMNYWIKGEPAALRSVLRRVDLLMLNDEELAMLTGLADITHAAQAARELGPQVVVVKKGPHGAAALGPWGWVALPALPVSEVRDPTGAGDSFAGGLLGYLAGKDWHARDRFAEGLAVGTAAASLVVEQFGTSGIAGDRRELLRQRVADLSALTRFSIPPEL